MLATLRLFLPALIPSWRFFKSVAPSPRVQWRLGDSAWVDFRPRPQRISAGTALRHLFWNAGWNEMLYAVSLAERLTTDPTAHAEDELFRLIAGQVDASAGRLQFQLLFVTATRAEVMYLSAARAIKDIAR